jgi:hypothetical protein
VAVLEIADEESPICNHELTKLHARFRDDRSDLSSILGQLDHLAIGGILAGKNEDLAQSKKWSKWEFPVPKNLAPNSILLARGEKEIAVGSARQVSVNPDRAEMNSVRDQDQATSGNTSTAEDDPVLGRFEEGMKPDALILNTGCGFLAIVEAIVGERECEAARVTRCNTIREDAPALGIDDPNLCRIPAAVLNLISKEGCIIGDAMNSNGCEWALGGRIDQYPFSSRNIPPRINARLLLALASPTEKAMPSHSYRLVHDLHIQQSLDTAAQFFERTTNRKICLAPCRLFLNPLSRFRPCTVFKPTIGVANSDTMDIFLDDRKGK